MNSHVQRLFIVQAVDTGVALSPSWTETMSGGAEV